MERPNETIDIYKGGLEVDCKEVSIHGKEGFSSSGCQILKHGLSSQFCATNAGSNTQRHSLLEMLIWFKSKQVLINTITRIIKSREFQNMPYPLISICFQLKGNFVK